MVRDTLKIKEELEHLDLYACALFGINYPDLRRQSRKRNYVEARQMLWKLLKATVLVSWLRCTIEIMGPSAMASDASPLRWM